MIALLHNYDVHFVQRIYELLLETVRRVLICTVILWWGTRLNSWLQKQLVEGSVLTEVHRIV